MSTKRLFQNFGIGIGLRPKHMSLFLDPISRPRSIDWVEVISDNFMAGPKLQNTRGLKNLMKVRESYPVALHGVSMSVGSASGFSVDYLKRLKVLVDQIQPIAVSDHLCWSQVAGRQTFDLNPLPYTLNFAKHVADQILQAQDVLGRRMLIENLSTYVTYRDSEMTEAQFLSEVVRRADCGLLLDINNVYVSATNHRFDPKVYLEHLPHDRVGQHHLAGHTSEEGFLLDTHDQDVPEAVWELFGWYGKRFGHASTMIERDGNIPEWVELEKEVLRLRESFSPESGQASAPYGVRDQKQIKATGGMVHYARDQHQWVDALLGKGSPPDLLGRFEEYEHGFWARIEEVIETDFPEFVKTLSNFEQLTREIFLQTPPTSQNLDELGLQWLEGLRRSKHPGLAIAEQDWARNLAYLSSHAKAGEGVERQLGKLGELVPEVFEQVQIVLHPSLQVLPDQRSVYWHDGQPKEKHFSVNDWPAMVALISGLPISKWDSVPGFSPALVQAWTQDGLIYGFKCEGFKSAGYEKIRKDFGEKHPD